jgi:hypothetical protein
LLSSRGKAIKEKKLRVLVGVFGRPEQPFIIKEPEITDSVLAIASRGLFRCTKSRVRISRTRLCVTDIHPIRADSTASSPAHPLSDAVNRRELAPPLAKPLGFPDQLSSPRHSQKAACD